MSTNYKLIERSCLSFHYSYLLLVLYLCIMRFYHILKLLLFSYLRRCTGITKNNCFLITFIKHSALFSWAVFYQSHFKSLVKHLRLNENFAYPYRLFKAQTELGEITI